MVFGIFTVLSVVFPLLVIDRVDTFESSGTSEQELELLAARSQRSVGYYYYYDGGWQDWTGAGTAPGERLELDRIEGATVEELVREVEQLVEDPTASYVIVNARGGEDGVCLSAYAMNEYVETAYLDATCSGKVVRTCVS